MKAYWDGEILSLPVLAKEMVSIVYSSDVKDRFTFPFPFESLKQ